MPSANETPLWIGSEEFCKSANLTDFMEFVSKRSRKDITQYENLRLWSVRNSAEFWSAIWAYFRVISEGDYDRVIGDGDFINVRWFDGAKLNYAEHILRNEENDPNSFAIHYKGEGGTLNQMTWRELGDAVRAVASSLRSVGIQPGDRVVSYMPNSPETVIAMLATTAIGAVWASAAPEFGSQMVVDRFEQIAPKLIFSCDGYVFGGRTHDRRDEVRNIVNSVPSIEHVIWFDYANLGPFPQFKNAQVRTWQDFQEEGNAACRNFFFERVSSNHPLWVLFSSGTTGLPKAIVHSHVGVLLEHLKTGALHCNLDATSTMFFYTTTGWMMWNALMVSLLVGGAIVLYDGSPTYPHLDTLWELTEESGATLFGASPTYVEALRSADIVPRNHYKLDALSTVILSGSPAGPDTFHWFYESVKRDLWVTSQSGGTEFCSAIVGGVPILPVYAGEIQARLLGVDVRVFNDAGIEVVGEEGELVIAAPMPSMPLRMWNDEGNERYRASYFDVFDQVWRHGDRALINAHGGCYIYGRSDSTLNRHGVRIGSSEIYRIVERFEEVVDSIVVGIDLPGERSRILLFLQMAPDHAMSESLKSLIKNALRTDGSPRHVPDEIYEVRSIPYTLTGKKMEVPVRRLLMGADQDSAFNAGAMRDPQSMLDFIQFGKHVTAA